MIEENDFVFKLGLGEEGKVFFEVYPEMKEKVNAVVKKEDLEMKEKEEGETADISREKTKTLFDPFSATHRKIVPSVGSSKLGRKRFKVGKSIKIGEYG